MAPETPPSRRLVSLNKAADYLDTSPRTIRRAIAEGRLTGYRFGPRTLRVDLNEIDAVLRPIPTTGGAA
jgi:excisionase family DNA binding protein